MVSQAFRDMIAELLPSQSEQDNFFNSFQTPLKKSLSINRHRAPDFEKKNPDFLLGTGPFHEFPDTQYVDREDTSIALGKTRQHLTGQFYIQEVAAALPANILKSLLKKEKLPSEPIKILDVCAAPG
jgi:16S rRNA C967 or C1407 C5-methylase (RsmB/RsmF family)